MKIILIIYIILYFHMAIHEASHMLVAYKLGMKIREMKIGSEYLSLKWKNLSISPILSSGYIDVDAEETDFRNLYRVILFFEAGPVSNLLLGIVLQAVLSNIWGKLAFFTGLFLFVGNNIPFLKKTDGYMAWSIVKNEFRRRWDILH